MPNTLQVTATSNPGRHLDELGALESDRKRDLISTARHRFKIAMESEAQIREEALEDLQFMVGEQWDLAIKSARKQDSKPCLTINRIPQFIKQVTNSVRLSRPSPQVNPVGDGGDQSTALVLEGLIRHIQQNSSADAAYDTAFETMCACGFGYFRIRTEYVKGTFDQEIIIDAIPNCFSVLFDPTATKPDKSDIRWAFIVDEIPIEEYKKLYPDSSIASGLEPWVGVGGGSADWANNKSVRVCEYFHIEKEKSTLFLLDDGSNFTGKEEDIPEGRQIIRSRPEYIEKVHWDKINGVEVLEHRILAGKYIPVVGVFGDELRVDGRRHLSGMIRFSKDSQRRYNVQASAITENIALSTKSPWLVAEGQLEGYEDSWRQANTRNFPYLAYKSVDVNGKPAPPPIRNTFEPPIMALSRSLADADNDLKSTMGIFDASLGKRGPEESGKAILSRQKQADTANGGYTDNLNRALKLAAKIMIDMIPYIYDREGRVQRIIGVDNKQRNVPLNMPHVDPLTNKLVHYDLDAGLYDVTVSIGPTEDSKRIQATESMMALIQAFPQMAQFVGDLLVSSMDWPNAPAIAERLHKMLPPQLQDPEEGQIASNPNDVQKITQLSGMVEQLTQALHAETNQRDAKTLQLESAERIALRHDIAKMIGDGLRGHSEMAAELLKHEISSAMQRERLLHNDQALISTQSHEKDMASLEAQQNQQQPSQQ